jgi:peroxiredoxin
VNISSYRFGALLVAALAFASGCGGSAPTPGAPPAPTSADIAPDFELSTLDGGRERLADHRGKDVVLVDFWATFCEPCLLALPELDALYRRERARGFVVLGVSIDEASSSARVRSEAQKLGLSFPILLDPDTRVVSLYNPRASAPYSVLIGRDGRVIRRQEGYTPGERESLERAIDDALGR